MRIFEEARRRYNEVSPTEMPTLLVELRKRNESIQNIEAFCDDDHPDQPYFKIETVKRWERTE